jgi:tetratricopeptide (TPR) repeat protein
MKALKTAVLVLALMTAAAAQSPEPPLDEARLTIHTLVREDIFAGLLTDDLKRLGRAEKNIEVLLEKRPAAKPDLLAWKASTRLYRAVRAHEEKRPDEFRQSYRQALDLFAEARRLSPQNGSVAAVTGGSYMLMADRLPKEEQAAAWAAAYDAFQLLWQQQARAVDKLPVHHRGELLGGLAQSAQRTGRAEEMQQYLDKIIELMPGTPYEPVAKRWKDNPSAAVGGSVTCLTCHEAGRLSARVTALNSK